MGTDFQHQQSADKRRHGTYLDGAIDSLWRRDPNATTPQPQDYLKDLIKAVPLFMGGRAALMGASALGAVDQMHTGDSAAKQAVDGLLGAIKGASTKASFDKLCSLETNFVLKGVGMGITARTLDVGLTRETYMNREGEFSMKSGAMNIAAGAMGPKALAADIMIGGMGFGAMRGLEKIGLERLQESRLAGTMMTGTIFGGSSGMYQEMQRQSAEGKFDPLGIAKETFLHGGIGAVGAAPGGLQTALRYRVSDYGPVSLEQSQANFSRLHDPVETVAQTKEQIYPNRKWESSEQFHAEGLRMADVPVREYSIQGHTTKLQIPIAYDDALPGIRQMRAKASEPLIGDNPLNLAHTLEVAGARLRNDFNSTRGRFLPEDLVRGLDQTPDSKLIDSVMALAGEAPYSYRMGRFRERNKAIAEMLEDNRFLFFRPPENWHPDKTFLHEWSHIQQRDNRVALSAYHAALKLEEFGWDHHNYAKKNVLENWAVNSEPLLGADPAPFKKLVENAPLRSAVLGKALEESLAAVPPERRPENYGMLIERVNYIKQHAVREARRILERTAGGDERARSAGIMREFLDGKITPARADEILGMDWKYDYHR